MQPFLKIIEIINNSIKPEDRILLIDFVKNIKCNSVVRTVIGTTRCETIEDLKTILTERYKIKKTIPQIQNKLSKFIQGNDSIRNYSDKILKLIDELNELQILELGLSERSNITNVKK